MIHIIYMAAGNSRRFGSNKLFYELDGKPMYRHLLERLIEIKDRYNKLKKGWKKMNKKSAESNNPVIDITVVTRSPGKILDYCSSIPDCHAVLSSGQRKGHILHHKSRNYGGAGAEKDRYADVAKQCVAEKAGKKQWLVT